MNIIVAIDSFKGSLSSLQAGSAAEQGILRALPDATVSVRPVADGGEGTVAALVSGLKGKYVTISVTGPLGQPVEATYGILPDQTAVIEMAEAAGLPLVPPEARNPMKTTTYGVGELIRHALDQGYRTLILVCALGGRLDHTLANIQNAASAAAEGANVTILDEREEITFLTGGTLRLPRRKGWGLSVFSLTDRCTGVCLRGVKYRLEDAVLTNRVPLGVSNEFAAPEAEISLTQGILMIAQTKK